jgi:hypothetical protein
MLETGFSGRGGNLCGSSSMTSDEYRETSDVKTRIEKPMASDGQRETRGPTPCTQGWEALRGDSLGWLLDQSRPNLHWRVLVELVGRPADSPAVRRARGGANAAEPVAGLLADLQPDGRWATSTPRWNRYAGPGWRLLAAVKWGADPEDPRLHAASERVLETAPGEGGLTRPSRPEPDPRLTARALAAMVFLGWGQHPRVQEWLAWFDATGGWEDDPTSAVAVLGACRGGLRPGLCDRAADGLGRSLSASGGRGLTTLGHPNLLRTDLAEVFAGLAGAETAWRPGWRPALERLQRLQGDKGRWARRSPVPPSLGTDAQRRPSGWITLAATCALLAYAVDAGLPRFFPHPPGQRREGKGQ